MSPEPMERRIGIIGSAGRGTDGSRLTRELYDAMYDRTLAAMRDFEVTDATSGGAALADHLAVRAFLDGEATSLSLFLPADWDGRRFAERGGRGDPGSTTNRYHAAFSQACGLDSLGELGAAIRGGARVAVHRGFKNRNLEVAAASTHLLAFTYGRGDGPVDVGPDDDGFRDFASAGLKDGGTAHTWGQAWRCDAKRHVNLWWLERTLAPAPHPLRTDAAALTRRPGGDRILGSPRGNPT